MGYEYEVHTIKTNGDDLGILIFENGELAVYQTEKIANKVAEGMNRIYTQRHFVVIRRRKE